MRTRLIRLVEQNRKERERDGQINHSTVNEIHPKRFTYGCIRSMGTKFLHKLKIEILNKWLKRKSHFWSCRNDKIQLNCTGSAENSVSFVDQMNRNGNSKKFTANASENVQNGKKINQKFIRIEMHNSKKPTIKSPRRNRKKKNWFKLNRNAGDNLFEKFEQTKEKLVSRLHQIQNSELNNVSCNTKRL